MWSRLAAASMLSLAAPGCGGGDSPGTDAGGADAGAGVDAAGLPAPAPPAPPAPPALLPCPEGWSEVTRADGPTTCEPWSVGQPPCPPGEARFPGDPACAPLGSPCPDADLPEPMPGDALHVVAGAVDGDGSRDRPYGRIADALRDVGVGGTVVIGRGVYDESVIVSRAGVTLRGACPSATRLEPTAAGDGRTGAIAIRAPDVTIRDVSLGGRRPGLHVQAAGAVAEAVEIRAASQIGIVCAVGCDLSATEIVVRDTRSAGAVGQGILARDGRIVVRRAALSGNVGASVLGSSGSTVELEAVAVQGTAELPAARLGSAVSATGGVVRARECLFEDGVGTGIGATEGGRLTVERSIVRVARQGPADVPPTHAFVAAGGELRIVRSAVVGTVYALGPATLALEDVVVGDEAPPEDADVGVRLEAGASADLTRVSIRGMRGAGLIAGPSTVVAARDLAIADVRPTVAGADGRGMSLQQGASADFERVSIERVNEVGIYAGDPETRAEFVDLVVRDTESEVARGQFGRAMSVQTGAAVTVTRGLLAQNREAGVFCALEGARVELVHVAIERTIERACAETTCRGSGVGHGVVSLTGCTASLERFLVAESRLAGLVIAGGGALTAREGVVRGNAVGVNVQQDGFDPATVTDEVYYVDNGVNLDARELALPDAVAP